MSFDLKTVSFFALVCVVWLAFRILCASSFFFFCYGAWIGVNIFLCIHRQSYDILCSWQFLLCININIFHLLQFVEHFKQFIVTCFVLCVCLVYLIYWYFRVIFPRAVVVIVIIVVVNKRNNTMRPLNRFCSFTISCHKNVLVEWRYIVICLAFILLFMP